MTTLFSRSSLRGAGGAPSVTYSKPSTSSSSSALPYFSDGELFDYEDWAAGGSSSSGASSSSSSFSSIISRSFRNSSRNLFLSLNNNPNTDGSSSSSSSSKARVLSLGILLSVCGGIGYLVTLLLWNTPRGAAYLDPEEHKKSSVMRLSPPFDRLRDVVFDQPVRKSDILFYWQTREVGGSTIPDMLGGCFGLVLADSPSQQWDKEPELRTHRFNGRTYINVDTTTLDGINRAKDLKLISSISSSSSSSSLSLLLGGKGVIIVSPNIREISDLMTEDNQGRIFAFFRHPIERELARGKAGVFDNNYMTRFILNKPTGELTFVDLGMAKKVIREKIVVGLLDENIYESVQRMIAYFGWKASSDVCVDDYIAKLPKESLGDLVDGTNAAWKLLEPHNIYDIQLYEHARSVFRSQKQTIVSLQKQLQLSGIMQSKSDEDGEE